MSSGLPQNPSASYFPSHRDRESKRKPPFIDELAVAKTISAESLAMSEFKDGGRKKRTRLAKALRGFTDTLRDYLLEILIVIAICFLGCVFWVMPKRSQESDTESDME
jgi:hypothetical protein